MTIFNQSLYIICLSHRLLLTKCYSFGVLNTPSNTNYFNWFQHWYVDVSA